MGEQTELIKNKRFTTTRKLAFFTFLLIILILSIPLYIKFSTRHKVFTQIKNLNEREFVIVLGAGIKVSGNPGSYLRQRLDDVVTLYKTKNSTENSTKWR